MARHLAFLDECIMQLLSERTASDSTSVLIVSAPPRHGKSEFISKYLPAWYLGRHPDHRVILTSYADRLAKTFGRRVRELLEERASWFGLRGIADDVSAANDWQIAGHDGGMLTAGVGGPVTGRGADLLIVDDPIKNAEQAVSETVRQNQWDWFQSTAWTRLEPGGVCVVMMTRWHQEDLVGQLLKCGAEDLGARVIEIKLPAIAEENDMLGRAPGEPLWPERWSLAVLERRRALLDDYWWKCLYQQHPGQFGRAEWPDAYFAEPFWADPLDWPDSFEVSAMAIDPSKGRETGDYSAIVFMGLSRGLLWVDARIARMTTTEICETTVEFWRQLQSDRVGVESNAFQDLLAPEIERVQRATKCPPLPICLIHNMTNKQLRIGRLGPYLARHAYRFCKNKHTELLVKQLRGFPLADFDDGPDAMEMAQRLVNHLATTGR